MTLKVDYIGQFAKENTANEMYVPNILLVCTSF